MSSQCEGEYDATLQTLQSEPTGQYSERGTHEIHTERGARTR